MRRLLELMGAVEYLFFGQFQMDFDCNRAKINQAVKKLMHGE